MKCCNFELEKVNRPNNKVGLFCKVCGRKGEGINEDEAFVELQIGKPQHPDRLTKQDFKKEIIVNDARPSNPVELVEYTTNNQDEIKQLAAPFVSSDTKAFKRMLKKNIKYVTNQKDKKFLDVWKTPEGQESIVSALQEAFSLGASLPEMGYIIPYGSVVEFIPKVEAYNFALTTGKNSPFKYILTECLYDGDNYEVSRQDGAFSLQMKKVGVPRGDLVQVAVFGFNYKLDMVIGEVYDVDRLLEKAREHSTGYKYYCRDKVAFDLAKSEGTLQEENGMLYMNKHIHSKNGGFNKKVFEDDLINPYSGGNKPEMLRKIAAKSFLRPFIMVRNSEAAYSGIKENRDMEKAVDDLLDLGDCDIIDNK